jgi:hypothetical protein
MVSAFFAPHPAVVNLTRLKIMPFCYGNLVVKVKQERANRTAIINGA